MITDEDAKKAAEVLVEYCRTKVFGETHGCDNCAFNRSGTECLLDYYVPCDWQLENIK